MKLPRRAFLHLAAGAAALPFASRIAYPHTHPPGRRSEPPVRPLAGRLAPCADGLRYEDIDAATIERVKTHVIDTIGCGIGAFDERPVGICRNVALAVGGNATIIGTDRRTTPDLASFANGAAFRYFDFNDTYVGRFSIHPSDHIAACLAVAETERASAQDLITSIVIAYEVNCRLVDALDITTHGWGAAGQESSGSGARRRETHETRSRPAGTSGQSRRQRPYSDGPDPSADAVRLERVRRRRSRRQW